MANAADIHVDTLIDSNVKVIFGQPGDGINGVMEALRTRQDQIRFIQVRHEDSAAFMASAYAKSTGEFGVCLAKCGPDGTHLLTGPYDAKLDQIPVLLATGMQYHDLIETFTQQDVSRSRGNKPKHVANRCLGGQQLPDQAQLQAAADLLNAAAKVAILAGRGALGETAGGRRMSATSGGLPGIP